MNNKQQLTRREEGWLVAGFGMFVCAFYVFVIILPKMLH